METHYSKSSCEENSCPIKGLDGRINPSAYHEEGRFELLNQTVHSEAYYSDYHIRCPKCLAEFVLSDNIGYHYPIYYYPHLL